MKHFYGKLLEVTCLIKTLSRDG
jgi:hypothetical protein